ncbi:MAG: hypothetical protein WCP11_02115 [Candidatus Saccharibacteria bacterium]
MADIWVSESDAIAMALSDLRCPDKSPICISDKSLEKYIRKVVEILSKKRVDTDDRVLIKRDTWWVESFMVIRTFQGNFYYPCDVLHLGNIRSKVVRCLSVELIAAFTEAKDFLLELYQEDKNLAIE